ncbi:MAG: fused MFS/spermidine synthase [Acidobacteriia bacterium]|nr:fused MFS/spermidine synthase [Terriglobia bacterium]
MPLSSESASPASLLTSSIGSDGGAPGHRGAPLALYAVTIFFSAFLLFEIEPIIAKIVLPWFGGSAAVWTTCLLFFQTVLLAGYLYAHVAMRRLAPRTQVFMHIGLLAASILTLPVIPGAAWKPLGNEDPSWRILGLLAVTLGLPYLLLSATTPMLQAWYARTHENATPYRLFALSNAGSMLALVSYPVLVEPVFSTGHQAWTWSAAYLGFVLLCGSVAWLARTGRAPINDVEAADDSPPGWGLQLTWVSFAACGSTMLLAVTNHLTQNVASIPFLWILPLTLYLLSFILCFEGRGWYHRPTFLKLAAVALGSMAYAMGEDFQNPPLSLLIGVFAGGLFVCTMVCHGELARLKPSHGHLTSFYLMISIGGALGGVLVGLVAPHFFSGYFELPIAMVWCAVMIVLAVRPGRSGIDHRLFAKIVWIGSIGCALALATCLGYEIHQFRTGSLLLVRNFYGALRVNDEGDGVEEAKIRKLTHGTINHGEEFLDAGRHMQPTTYYGYKTGIGLAIQEAQVRLGLRVGVIGLGTGTIAAYGRPGDTFRFYDINPLVIDIARSQFRFVPESKAKIDIVLGDARLSLEREPPQNYDILAVDAFSSDSIPVHLLTREAFGLYFRHLQPGGVLAVHVSNKHLDLAPVVENAANSLGRRSALIDTEDDDDNAVFGATWVLISTRESLFQYPFIRRAATPVKRIPGLRMWTDDYSNLFQILK